MISEAARSETGRSSADADCFDGSLERNLLQLFQKHSSLLLRFLEARLDDRQEARDIAQEAYARLLELRRPNTIGFLRAYLFRVAANLAIDRIRSRAVARRLEVFGVVEQQDQSDSAERQAIAAEEASRFWESIQELPPHYREAVVMSRIQDLSCGEIALRTGKTDRTIRRYVACALAYCRLRILGASAEDATAAISADRGVTLQLAADSGADDEESRLPHELVGWSNNGSSALPGACLGRRIWDRSRHGN